MTSAIAFDNSYSRMPSGFSSAQQPTPVAQPGLIAINDALAAQLGINAEWLRSPEGLSVLAGNAIPEGATPIATVYAGHQFGSYNPQLGDGRAILLGEVVDRDGARMDVQLKGAGPTPYSRGGDGRSPIGPVVREYLISEAMHTLGVPTTRALAAVTTGEAVVRNQMEPGAILTRIASSHLRVGTVQFFSASGDKDKLNALVSHVLARHYPQHSGDNPALALLEAVVAAQARLIAHWQLLGFIHGVMNTDNMLLCGETVDYGPCAFMDSFHPDTVFSSIDHGGRYAYRNQPGIGHWNLSVLAQALLPVIADDPDTAVALAQASVDRYPELFMEAHSQGLATKLGLAALSEEDTEQVEALFTLMADESLDFTLTFRQLTDLAAHDEAAHGIGDLAPESARLNAWIAQWQERLAVDPQSKRDRHAAMRRANPVFIPRNHLVQEAISAAEGGDFGPFHALNTRWQQPFDYDAADRRLATPPLPEQRVHQTFCGT